MRSSAVRWLALIALGFAGYVMLADFVNLRRTGGTDAPVVDQWLTLPQPWGGHAWRRLARTAGDRAMLAPEVAIEVLSKAAARYPLDAVQWLDLARIHARAGDAGGVERSLLRANAVQPLHRVSTWAAAQVALQTGNVELAERHLSQWLTRFPRDTGQALFVGRRWIDDPGQLLDRVLPPGRDFLVEAMRVARQQRDLELAEAVWQRLDPEPRLSDATFLEFAELLIDTADSARVQRLWASRDPDYRSGGIANGGFVRPLGEPLGLNWRVDRLPAGVRVRRDEQQALSQPASLKIEFDGRENVFVNAPWIRIPVIPGRRYRLAGSWRAQGLTTRSLPYLRIEAERGDLRGIRPVPAADFDWQPWELSFTVPDESSVLRLRVMRDRTDAFDRNIGGALWLDDLVMEAVPMGPQPTRPPAEADG